MIHPEQIILKEPEFRIIDEQGFLFKGTKDKCIEIFDNPRYVLETLLEREPIGTIYLIEIIAEFN